MIPEAAFFAKLLSGSCKPHDLSKIERSQLTEEWVPAYDFVVNHLRTYQELPHYTTLEEAIGQTLPVTSGDSIEVYANAVIDNHLRLVMDQALMEYVAAPMRDGDIQAAKDGIGKALVEVRNRFPDERKNLTLEGLGDNVYERMAAYHLRVHAKGKFGIPFLYDSITNATGGLLANDLWILLARPSIGKSWIAIFYAIYLLEQGYSVLFVSMETPPAARTPKSKEHRIRQGRCIRCFAEQPDETQECPAAKIPLQKLSMRFDAVAAGISPYRFLRGNLNDQELDRLRKFYEYAARENNLYGRLRIVAAPRVTSIAHIESEAIDFDPDIIIADSIYLAAKKRKFDKANPYAALVKDFKRLLERLGIPGFATWHFNRKVGPEDTTASYNDAENTDELGKIADTIIGKFRTPRDELVGESHLKPLKVRDGVRPFQVNIQFQLKENLAYAELPSKLPSELEDHSES